MRPRTLRFLVSALLTGALMSLLIDSNSLAAGPAIAPVTPGVVDSGPRTNGQVVVWAEDSGSAPYRSEIFAAELDTGRRFVVADGPDSLIQPDIDGNTVVWLVDYAGCPPCNAIHARDIGSPGSPEIVVDAPSTLESFPAISGDWVVWIAGNQVRGRNIGTMAPASTLATPDAGWSVGPPAIDGDRIVWSEQAPGPNRTMNWQILTLRLGQSQPTVVSAGIFLAGQSLSYTVHANLVVFTYAGNDPALGPLQAVDVTTSTRMTIADRAIYPTSDGRYIFWQTTIGQRAQLLGFDRQTLSTFEVPGPGYSNGLPDLAGGALVWLSSPSSDFIGATMDIGAAWLPDALPTGARPDPGTTSPDWFFFPETNHYLASGFKSFWVQSGGLPVFGYPLTEEFREQAPDQHLAFTVQYFERQRFEYHPELAGTPYETELGRLGAEDAAARNLVVTRPFQPAEPDSSAGCRYFGETEHSVCGEFLTYWQSHGLEFGDPGYSFRESLALFGYPISEPFVDPDSGLTVQYFERARLEYHPGNPEPYRVLLGRLGADLLARRGWS